MRFNQYGITRGGEMKAYIQTLFIASCCISSALYACRVDVINDSHINILIKDQEPNFIYVVKAGASQVVGETHRRPNMSIFMQVDPHKNAPYKKQFLVEQIACGTDKSKPVQLYVNDLINNQFDTTLFKRSASANSHKKIGPPERVH
jgi:hypothetical protein